MKKALPVVVATALTAAALSPVIFAHAAPATPQSKSTSSKVSGTSSQATKVAYSFGYLMGKSNREVVTDLDTNAFVSGFQEGYGNKAPQLTEEQMRSTILEYKKNRDAEEMKKTQALASENTAKGTAFLAENAKKPGIKTTASGLQYEVLKEGTGAQPVATDQVSVNYEGTLIDGTVFDSSYARNEPVTFPLNQVIGGWTEGVQLMKVGSVYKFYIPSNLAYGENGAGPIPPNSVLIFKIELLKIVK